jgi:hypothetical protein
VGSIVLGVRETFRRHGTGAALLLALIATGDILIGLQWIPNLIVLCDNDAAIRLYRKFGFEIEGRHRSFLRRGSDLVDAFTMARVRDAVTMPACSTELLRRIQLLRPLWDLQPARRLTSPQVDDVGINRSDAYQQGAIGSDQPKLKG